jgi:hypothetical protein
MLAAKPEADEGVSFGLGEVHVGVRAASRSALGSSLEKHALSCYSLGPWASTIATRTLGPSAGEAEVIDGIVHGTAELPSEKDRYSFGNGWLELGTWNLELGTWNLVARETVDRLSEITSNLTVTVKGGAIPANTCGGGGWHTARPHTYSIESDLLDLDQIGNLALVLYLVRPPVRLFRADSVYAREERASEQAACAQSCIAYTRPVRSVGTSMYDSTTVRDAEKWTKGVDLFEATDAVGRR